MFGDLDLELNVQSTGEKTSMLVLLHGDIRGDMGINHFKHTPAWLTDGC